MLAVIGYGSGLMTMVIKRPRPRFNVRGEKIMNIRYNSDIGAFVNTANDEIVTQAELLEWAAANPEPIKEAKKPNTEILEEVIATFNKTG